MTDPDTDTSSNTDDDDDTSSDGGMTDDSSSKPAAPPPDPYPVRYPSVPTEGWDVPSHAPDPWSRILP